MLQSTGLKRGDKMQYEKSYSTAVPEELDINSSPTSVYVRKNICELPPDENNTTLYECDEICIPKNEYIAKCFMENEVRDDVLQELILMMYGNEQE